MAADEQEHTVGGAAALPRRLATIVALDAAGYSHQSEVDEAATVREITALGDRIRATAASHHGRVFNTAGDGFMLEFPSASAAVAAAEEIQARDRVPLRIGVHIGEVHETPTGDLLGKGVNIAARLMALAQAGSIVISIDVKRALSSEVAVRVRRRGVVRLDKMDERIELFELGSSWQRPRPLPLRWIAIGAGAVALAVLVWFGVQAFTRPGAQAIAVLEFRALEPGLQSFSTGLADRLIGAMSEHDLQPAHTDADVAQDRVLAAAETGAAFVLDGTVRPEGDDLLVSARLIDTRGNIAIWSNEYRRAAREQNYMQEQIATDVARVLRCAMDTVRGGASGIEPATLSLFLRACDRISGILNNPQEAHLLARQVTERAPGFSRGWSMRARTAARMASASSEEAEAFAAETREAAARSRRLDRANGEGYLAEASLLPPYDWRGRQALIDQALRVQPDLAAAHSEQAWLYSNVGRSEEALNSMRRAAALEPLNAVYWAYLPPLLSAAGGDTNQQEANELRERLYRIWPESTEAWWNRFFNATYVGDPAAALQMLVGGLAIRQAFDELRWRCAISSLEGARAYPSVPRFRPLAKWTHRSKSRRARWTRATTFPACSLRLG